MTLRVIQWTTGNIGRRSLAAIIERDDFELVVAHTEGHPAPKADVTGQ